MKNIKIFEAYLISKTRWPDYGAEPDRKKFFKFKEDANKYIDAYISDHCEYKYSDYGINEYEYIDYDVNEYAFNEIFIIDDEE